VYDETKKKNCIVQHKIQPENSQYSTENSDAALQRKIVKMIEEEYGIPTQELEKVQKKYRRSIQ
jgi:hypothetical protein